MPPWDQVREAIVLALRASGALTAVVPADRIYGERAPGVPAYNFVMVGVPADTPFRLSGYREGEESTFMVTAFVEGLDSGPAATARKAVKDALDGAVLAVAGGLELVWQSGGLSQDGLESEQWRAVNVFSAA